MADSYDGGESVEIPDTAYKTIGLNGLYYKENKEQFKTQPVT
jgi:hypothetical protein